MPLGSVPGAQLAASALLAEVAPCSPGFGLNFIFTFSLFWYFRYFKE